MWPDRELNPRPPRSIPGALTTELYGQGYMAYLGRFDPSTSLWTSDVRCRDYTTQHWEGLAKVDCCCCHHHHLTNWCVGSLGCTWCCWSVCSVCQQSMVQIYLDNVAWELEWWGLVGLSQQECDSWRRRGTLLCLSAHFWLCEVTLDDLDCWTTKPTRRRCAVEWTDNEQVVAEGRGAPLTRRNLRESNGTKWNKLEEYWLLQGVFILARGLTMR